jgi:hypothetical protein
MDAGWIRTPEEYFSGSQTGFFGFEGRFIFENIYEVLMLDPKRRFTLAEIFFFKMWYTKIDPLK